jgi:hypothetical protein
MMAHLVDTCVVVQVFDEDPGPDDPVTPAAHLQLGAEDFARAVVRIERWGGVEQATFAQEKQ